MKSFAKEFLELKETRTDFVVDIIDLKKPIVEAVPSTTDSYKRYLKASREAQDHKAFKYRSGFFDPTDFVCQFSSNPDSAYACPRLAYLKLTEEKSIKVETPEVADYVTQQCQEFVTQVWPKLKFRTIYRCTTRIPNRLDRLHHEPGTFSASANSIATVPRPISHIDSSELSPMFTGNS